MQTIHPLMQSALAAFDAAFRGAPRRDPHEPVPEEFHIPPVFADGEQLVFSQPEWTVSADGSFESKYQVFQLPNGRFAPACMISRLCGEPTYARGDEVRDLDNAIRIASNLAIEEHAAVL